MTAPLKFILPIERIEMFLEKYGPMTDPNNEIVFQSDFDISKIKKQLENYDELVNALEQCRAELEAHHLKYGCAVTAREFSEGLRLADAALAKVVK